MTRAISERKIILLIGAVQFVNILDFMMVMPLGPDFSKALGFAEARIGWVGGAYTAAAALSGIIVAKFLDRFDRRKALAVTLLGLVAGTAMGSLATGLGTLLAARVLAGCFGGPTASLSLAIISDVVPPERRGRAMGAVMGSFSLAAVFGVPAGLELARLGGWRTPFLAVAGLGFVIAASAVFLLPPMTGHLAAGMRNIGSTMGAFLRRKTVLLSLASTALLMTANFAIVPNLATYWQYNLGYPREHLGMLYLIGGFVSFVAMAVAGRITDRVGATAVAIGGTVLYCGIVLVGIVDAKPMVSVMFVSVTFFAAAGLRIVPMQALASRVPAPDERGRFMSMQSFVQHMAASVGAVLASQMLSGERGQPLVGMAGVGWMAIALAGLVPVVLALVETRVKQREGERRQAAAAERLAG